MRLIAECSQQLVSLGENLWGKVTTEEDVSFDTESEFLKHEITLPEGYMFKDENGNEIRTSKIILEKANTLKTQSDNMETETHRGYCTTEPETTNKRKSAYKGWRWKYYQPNEITRLLIEIGFNKYPKDDSEEEFTCYLALASKFLREEKNIIIEATFNLMYKGQPRFSWRVLYNLTQHKGAYYTLDSVISKEDYDSYEEALSEGIKKAVKILKEK